MIFSAKLNETENKLRMGGKGMQFICQKSGDASFWFSQSLPIHLLTRRVKIRSSNVSLSVNKTTGIAWLEFIPYNQQRQMKEDNTSLQGDVSFSMYFKVIYVVC